MSDAGPLPIVDALVIAGRAPHPPAPIIDVFVTGKPEPAGSKRGFPNPKTGGIIITDANRKAKPWQRDVKYTVFDAIPQGAPLERGPLVVEFAFTVARPKGHYGTGKNAAQVKPAAPPYPATRPDVLKLARGVEDALSGLLWADDALIVHETLSKRYGSPEGVRIVVWRA